MAEKPTYAELEQMVEELRKSEKQKQTILNASVDMVMQYDTDLRIVWANKTAASVVNKAVHDIAGQRCYKIFQDRDTHCPGCPCVKALETGNVENKIMHHPAMDVVGESYWDNYAVPIKDDNGQLVGLAEIARNITHKVLAEEKRKKLEAWLRQAQKMEAISALAGGIAHQFNNALFAITGNLDLLEMDFPGNKNVADYIRKMKDSTRRMTRLTAQLLAYARGGKYQAKTISLSNFVRDTLPLVRHTIDSAISVDTNQPPGIFNVKADLTQMQMALSAILTNAAEAMDGKGQIRIVCRNTMITDETAVDFPGLKPGNYISLTITDDGKGMDEETKTRIFEPFFTSKFEGRGLGMAAAYGIVKNHDGWIAVDSELGKGTIVKIYLPAVEALVKEHAKPKTEPIKGQGTILVIEDEEMIMKVTRKILKKLGYSVLEAKTGQEAINVAKTFDGNIDLVMLDILLPDMSGNAIYPFLMAARPDLKVIVFSGYSIDGPAQEILNAGAQDFIQKPFSAAELSEKLRKVLGSEN